MKVKFLFAAFLAFVVICSCNSSENKTSEGTGDTAIIQNPTTVQKDSAVLSDDSATVKTAVGVKDEEKNAVQQEKQEAKKLKEAKESADKKH